MQNSSEYNDMTTRLAKAKNVNQNEILNGAANKRAMVSWLTYLNKTWNLSTLNFYNYATPIEGYRIKYEIRNKQLEFLLSNTVKVVDYGQIRNFTWIDSITQKPSYFVNGKELSFADVPIVGFLEVLCEAKTSLFEKIDIEIANANFNPLLDTRPEEATFSRKESFFLQKDNKVYRLKSKSDLFLLLDSKEVKEFVKLKHLKVNRREDMVAIINYYNSL